MEGEPNLLSDLNAATTMISNDINNTLEKNRKLESLEKKAVHLRLVLEKDFKEADIRWSLFVAAAFSFRYENCLRPFPPAYWKNGVKDMDELLNIITDVPALDLVLQLLERNIAQIPNFADILDLLFYVLVRLKEPSLKSIPSELHENLLMNINLLAPAAKPQFIFQVVSSAKSGAEEKWRELAKNHNVFTAFHGNSLENFYNILNIGFHQHVNKNSGNGKGVFLSTDLNVCLPYSPVGFGWGASCIGSHLSCVAMCEVVDVPEGINCQRPITPITTEGDYIDTKLNEMGIDKIPCKPTLNYCVSNAELVRVRYLLVYAKQQTTMRFSSGISVTNECGLRKWFSRHKLFSILFGYGLMLATIGLANNQPMNYYYKMILKQFELAYSGMKV